MLLQSIKATGWWIVTRGPWIVAGLIISYFLKEWNFRQLKICDPWQFVPIASFSIVVSCKWRLPELSVSGVVNSPKVFGANKPKGNLEKRKDKEGENSC
jgi:hypothetical protein